MNKKPPQNNQQKTTYSIDVHDELLKNATIHTNLKQEIIVTTEDRATLVLQNYMIKIEDKKSWVTPLSILLTLILVPVTADFKNALGIDASTWRAIFYIATFLVFIWFLYSLKKVWSARNLTITDVVSNLKKKQ